MPRRSKRVKVQTGLRPPKLGQSSRLRRDSFSKVGDGDQALQLARGLAEFSNTFSAAAGSFLSQRAEREEQAGRQAFLEAMQEQDNALEAINSGVIPPGASPFFKAGVQAEAGRAAAEDYFATFLESKGDLLDRATDLDTFDRAAREHFDEYLEQVPDSKRTDAFDVGFRSRAQARLETERRRFAGQIPAKVENESLEAMSARAFQETLQSYLQGADPSTIAGDLTAQLDESREVFGSPGQGDRQKVVAEAVVDVALRENDVRILNILDHMKSGHQGDEDRPNLSSVNAVRDLIDSAKKDIGIENNRIRSTAEDIHTQEMEDRRRGVHRDALEALRDADNPQTVDLTQYVDGLVDSEVPAWTARNQVDNLREAFVGQEFEDDEDIVREMQAAIYSVPGGSDRAVTEDDLNRALRSRDITPETHARLMREMEDARDNLSPLDRDQLNDGVSMLRSLFEEQPDWMGIEAGTRYNQAKTWFESVFGQWLISPDAEGAAHPKILETKNELVQEAARRFLGDAQLERFTETTESISQAP